MRRSKIGKVNIYISETKKENLSNELTHLYAKIIERKLNASPLTPGEKIEVIDKITFHLQEAGI